MSQYHKDGTGIIYSAHVKISDVNSVAEEMIQSISDTSWINTLDAVEATSFRATSRRTIDKLVNEIFAKVENVVTEEFGEYLISTTAQNVLEQEFSHVKFPLAELLKEKVSGNPGFDFHTESEINNIAFGEAKYSGVVSPYNKALKQIEDFISLGKDDAELIVIKCFASTTGLRNALEKKRAYVAAFSINSNKPTNEILSAITSKEINALKQYPELFIIGVEVDA